MERFESICCSSSGAEIDNLLNDAALNAHPKKCKQFKVQIVRSLILHLPNTASTNNNNHLYISHSHRNFLAICLWHNDKLKLRESHFFELGYSDFDEVHSSHPAFVHCTQIALTFLAVLSTVSFMAQCGPMKILHSPSRNMGSVNKCRRFDPVSVIDRIESCISGRHVV